jgi:hypothetical protein
MRTIVAALVGVLAASGPALAQRAPSSTEGRPPDARVGRSTADQAKKQIEAAGWREVKELRQGYDGIWHAMATKDGVRRRVAVTPDGVFPEGD